jgi:hypothetical protein
MGMKTFLRSFPQERKKNSRERQSSQREWIKERRWGGRGITTIPKRY